MAMRFACATALIATVNQDGRNLGWYYLPVVLLSSVLVFAVVVLLPGPPSPLEEKKGQRKATHSQAQEFANAELKNDMRVHATGDVLL
ncbi:hpp family protein [Moniliophthora roreri]|nr:hpp family protein [Moniliophthora roreri]